MADRLIRLSRKALAAFGAAVLDHAAATDCGHTRAEAVPALAHKFTGLVGPFHCLLQERH